MKNMHQQLLLLFICIAANNPSHAAPITESLEFTVEDSPILDIDVSFGDISLVNGESSKIVVEYDTQETTNIKVEQRGNGIYIEAKAIYNRGFSKWWKLWESREEAQYRIQVPVNSLAKIRLGGGEVVVRDFSGHLNLKGRGTKVSLYNSSVTADISTNGGDIFLQDSSGNFEIGSIGGSVEIEGMNDSNLDVSTISGDIDFSKSNFSGGRYDFSAVSGDIRISHSEDAAFELSGWYMKKPPKIDNGQEFWLKEEEITEETAWGKEWVGDERYLFKGTYNGGGSLVEIKTSHGLISLQLD